MGDRDILIQMVLMWAEEYEKGNAEACEMILGYCKNELSNKSIF